MHSRNMIMQLFQFALPELGVDGKYDDDCTQGHQYDGYHNNRDANGHGLVRSQSTARCCV